MIKKKIMICGEKWYYRVMSDAEFVEAHPKEDDADAITSGNFMDFRENKVDLPTIRHEVRHAYIAECCLSSTNDMTVEDMEEINATLDEKKWDRMNRTSKTIFRNILKEKTP